MTDEFDDDTLKMARLLAPGLKADEPDDDDDNDDDTDVLFAGDMTTKELNAMLAPMLREAIERAWADAQAKAGV